MESIHGRSSTQSSQSMAEAKATNARKSHSEAERRRRKRFNIHLSTLRSLLPSTSKTDKATVLSEVVRRVKELKETAATTELGFPEECVFPGESEELTLSHHEGGLVSATICCQDRPALMSDIERAVRSARLRVVRAEMATVGGRTKSIMWLQGGGSAAGCGGADEDTVWKLRRELKVVIDKPGPSCGWEP